MKYNEEKCENCKNMRKRCICVVPTFEDIVEDSENHLVQEYGITMSLGSTDIGDCCYNCQHGNYQDDWGFVCSIFDHINTKPDNCCEFYNMEYNDILKKIKEIRK